MPLGFRAIISLTYAMRNPKLSKKVSEFSEDMQAQIAHLVKIGSDLSIRQIHILFTLLDQGSLTVKALHENEGSPIDKPGVSRAVSRLKDLGYVNRQEHPNDRRTVLVSLTQTGRSFVKALL